MGSDDEGDAPIDIKSRIATFNQKADEASESSTQGAAAAKKPALPPPTKPIKLFEGEGSHAARHLRKTPSTTQLLALHRERGAASQKDSDEKNVAPFSASSVPKPPTRPRSRTGGAGRGDEGSDELPRLDVKDMIALYGGKGTTPIKPKPPIAPKPVGRAQDSGKNETADVSHGSGRISHEKPSIAISASSPKSTQEIEADLPLAGAPQIPARPGPQQPMQIESCAASSLVAAAPSLPPRRMTTAASSDDLERRMGKASISSDSLVDPPGLPKRPSSRSSVASTGTGGSNFDASDAPPPPPRHRTTLSADATGSSLATAQRRLPSPTVASSSSPKSSSPSLASSSPRVRQRPSSSTRAMPLGRSSNTSSPVPPASASMSSTETLAPPPRHIDTLRGGLLHSGSPRGGRAVPRFGGASFGPHHRPMGPQRQGAGRRRRRHPLAATRPQTDFSRQPESDAHRQRYESLFDKQVAQQQHGQIQSDDASESSVLSQGAVVKLWRRSRLDSAFLGRVWQEAVKQDHGRGVEKKPFVRAMSAIDAELKQRRQRRSAA